MRDRGTDMFIIGVVSALVLGMVIWQHMDQAAKDEAIASGQCQVLTTQLRDLPDRTSTDGDGRTTFHDGGSEMQDFWRCPGRDFWRASTRNGGTMARVGR